jgi:CcmD family protein
MSRFSMMMMVLVLALAFPATTLAAPIGHEAAGESNLGFLFTGFSVVWVGLIAYAFYVNRREQALRRELEELRHQLADKNPSD